MTAIWQCYTCVIKVRHTLYHQIEHCGPHGTIKNWSAFWFLNGTSMLASPNFSSSSVITHTAKGGILSSTNDHVHICVGVTFRVWDFILGIPMPTKLFDSESNFQFMAPNFHIAKYSSFKMFFILSLRPYYCRFYTFRASGTRYNNCSIFTC